MTSEKILLARQPIYDTSLSVAAYELLFRPADPTAMGAWDGGKATSEVILHAFTEIGIQTVTGSLPAYVNFTRKWLLETPSFDPKQVVIEVLEDIEFDDEVMAAISNLVSQGYKIALDDYVYDPKHKDVLRLASIVKLDVLENDKDTIAKWVTELRKFDLQLVAEKVETHEMMEYCKSLGFELFQGYFLCRPQLIKGSTLSASKVVVLRLLTELQNPDAEINDIEKMIAQDPTLTYKLLKVFSAAVYITPKKVDSIKRAITLLGLDKLKSWASVIAMSQMAEKPHALMMTALIRGKMCELLAEQFNKSEADRYFTVGLFSTLDAFFDRTMEEVMQNIPLEDDIADAILSHKGQLGKVLQSVIAHEQANWDNIDWDTLNKLEITPDELEDAYITSIRWSTSICNSILN